MILLAGVLVAVLVVGGLIVPFGVGLIRGPRQPAGPDPDAASATPPCC